MNKLIISENIEDISLIFVDDYDIPGDCIESLIKVDKIKGTKNIFPTHLKKQILTKYKKLVLF